MKKRKFNGVATLCNDGKWYELTAFNESKLTAKVKDNIIIECFYCYNSTGFSKGFEGKTINVNL
jgi:hypothetical protein